MNRRYDQLRVANSDANKPSKREYAHSRRGYCAYRSKREGRNRVSMVRLRIDLASNSSTEDRNHIAGCIADDLSAATR